MDEIEIPEAIRENIELPTRSRLSQSLPLILGSLFCLGIAGIFLIFLWFNITKNSSQTVKPDLQPVTPKSSSPESSVPQSKTINDAQTKSNTTIAKPTQEDLLGHLPYELAPPSSLEAITADGRLSLRSAAAEKFKQMQADAKAQGIALVPISAFRDTQTQEQLFFGVKEQRVQDASQRAEVSAPPGYSEHHTGYAIDIGDGQAPATNLEENFAQTPAYKWLQANALKYSFELSFPPDNSQGVSYEPWHWRFVGDRHSLETFYKGQHQRSKKSKGQN